jgi:putative hemolysin
LAAAAWTIKQSGQPLALIIDEFGGLQGLVSQTDVLESLVGDIRHAGHDPQPEIVPRPDGSWLLDGRLSVSELKDLLDVRDLPDEARAGYDTLGGLVMTVLGQVPTVGQAFDLAGFRLEVVDMDGRRVDRVLVTRNPAPDTGAAPASG